jgi:hypothetical protein
MKTHFLITAVLTLVTINCFSQSTPKRDQKKASPQTKTAIINPAIKQVIITKTSPSSNNRTSKLVDTTLLKNRAIKHK